CKQALKSHQLNEYVDVIIGRDSVENRKPHPEPLIRTIENLGLNRDEVKFIGDSKTDADMAQRANVTFEYAYRK
ncbi:MAG: HAD-IA family hydrolase, partial [Halobacteriaceae archaeon]